PIFALTSCERSELDWNRDPLTGQCAPRLFGPSIDVHSQEDVGNIKYLWELNRHLNLPLLAQAYRLTDDQHYLQVMQQQLESWFEQCSYLSGPNWNSGLEAAIRLINWSVAWQLVGAEDSAMFTGEDGEAFRDRWLNSV